jgi:heptosyltransferase-3
MKAGSAAPVVISPFANERAREWPTRHYQRLIEILVREQGMRVAIVGTRSQRVRANYLVRGFSSAQVANICGTINWSELLVAVDLAPYVIANNSGVAHLAAARGRWTLCLFSGSHSFIEWMPRGQRVVVISRAVACAPCELGGLLCPNGLACMADLQPEEAFRRFQRIFLGAPDTQ